MRKRTKWTIRDEFDISHDGHPHFMEVKHREDSCGKIRHWLAHCGLVSHKMIIRIKLYDLAIEWRHYTIYISSLDIVSSRIT